MSSNRNSLLSYHQVNGFDNQIVQNARSIGLDVQMNMVTLGDGNCWYRSVIQQMMRTEIIGMLEPCKIYHHHHQMRLDVVNYVREQERTSQYVQRYREFYETTLHEDFNNMPWAEFLLDQEENRVYCTELFTKATAVFLAIDIFVTSEHATSAHPYTYISRFWENSLHRSPCPMLIGNLGQNHFQSLVPSFEMMQAISCEIINSESDDVDFTITTFPSYASVCRKASQSQKPNKISDRQSPTFSKKLKLDNSSQKVVINSPKKKTYKDAEENIKQLCISEGS